MTAHEDDAALPPLPLQHGRRAPRLAGAQLTLGGSQARKRPPSPPSQEQEPQTGRVLFCLRSRCASIFTRLVWLFCISVVSLRRVMLILRLFVVVCIHYYSFCVYFCSFCIYFYLFYGFLLALSLVILHLFVVYLCQVMFVLCLFSHLHLF